LGCESYYGYNQTRHKLLAQETIYVLVTKFNIVISIQHNKLQLENSINSQINSF